MAVRFKRYQHVVSLGFFCSVALELDRYGLRDGSYPFDWIICPIEPTLAAVASYPEELINPATLERDATNAYIVHDTATGIDYYHDFRADEPIEDQIERVRAKYRRRAQRLTEAMSQSTLFVRYIADRAEFDFLNDNMATVLSTLRSANQSCDLMLIAPPETPNRCGGIPVHIVAPDEGDVVAREFASASATVHRALISVGYPLTKRITNLSRYRRSARGVARRERLKRRRRQTLRRALHLTALRNALRRLAGGPRP